MGWAIFWFDARRRFRNTASAMRATPTMPEIAPATMGVESESGFGSRAVDTELVADVMPKERPGVGPGVGAGDVAENDGAAR